MDNAKSPKKNTKDDKKASVLNEKFYTLLTELVETQSTILEKVLDIEKKIAQGEASANKDPLKLWKDM